MLTLRYEYFEDKDDQKSDYYANKKNQRMKFTISTDLYEQAIEFKEMKINQDTCNVKIFIISTGKSNWKSNKLIKLSAEFYTKTSHRILDIKTWAISLLILKLNLKGKAWINGLPLWY